MGTPAKCKDLPGYFVKNNTKIRGDREIAEGFNEFFANIGAKLDNQLKYGSKSYKEYLGTNIKSTFKFAKVTMEDINKII